jgi:hypothetical protein
MSDPVAGDVCVSTCSIRQVRNIIVIEFVQFLLIPTHLFYNHPLFLQ